MAYTNPDNVVEITTDEIPPRNPYVQGYGRKVPSAHKIKYVTNGVARWYRVYIMQYGNSGSAYILPGGNVMFLDPDTEHKFSV